MNIHQLTAHYSPEHDRILVRINTTTGEEMRLFLTRRLTLPMAPALQQAVTDWVAKNTAGPSAVMSPLASADAHAKRVLAEFKREESLQASDFQTPYKPPASLPLGPEPLLVTEINVTPMDGGVIEMVFNEKNLPPEGSARQEPRGFQVVLDQPLMHGFLHLLEQAVRASEWQSASEPATAAPEPALPGEGSSGSADRLPHLN